MKPLRIFISSPGDVAEEREKARQVIAGLQLRYEGQVALMPVLWEDLAIPATASFQEGIDFVLAERHRIDIAVFVLWSRLGSPLGAAITKPDGSIYRSGTEREFDLMLAAFEQSGRKMPVILAYTRDDNAGFNERLDARVQGEEALEEILSQRKLVKQFIRENFQDKEGHNLRAYHSYCEPVAFAQRLHVHLRGVIDDLLELEGTDATWTEAPYRSLEVFDIQHAPIFCGRDEETCDILQRLRDQQRGGCAFVCIVGASGSGKSSLARAGVAATLVQRSFDEGVKEWRTAVLLPSLAASDLFLALGRILAESLPELRKGIGGLEEFTSCLREQNFKAASFLMQTAFQGRQSTPNDTRILIILDQMEELWTSRSITAEQREHFLQILEALARSGHVAVLATLRSDFYPQAQLSEIFLRMKGERGHFDLIPPGPAALQQLIVQPARRAGLRFERDEQTGSTLDQRILKDASADPSALPLLQYSLAELYEHRDEKMKLLTFAAYEAMGGVEGALGRRAAQTFDGLPDEAQAALEELLPLLISVDIAGEQNAVRRRALLAELMSTPTRRQLTEALIAARFITTDEQGGEGIATLAHEALLRRWDRITAWINTNRDLLRMRTRVEQYGSMWEESGRNDSRLLPDGLPLEEGGVLVASQQKLLDEAGREFVARSSEHHRAQRKRRERLRMKIIGVLSLLLIASAFGTYWAIKERTRAAQARDLAEEAKGEADAQRDLATKRSMVIEKQSTQLKEESVKQENLLLKASHGDYEAALRSVSAGHHGEGLAYFERALSYAPRNDIALVVSATHVFGSVAQAWRTRAMLVQEEHITCMAFSPNGRYLAVGEAGGRLSLMDATTGKTIRREKFQQGFQAVCFSPDSTRIAVGTGYALQDTDGQVWVIEVATGKDIFKTGYDKAVEALCFSPDGGRLAVGNDTARVIELASGKEVVTMAFRSFSNQPKTCMTKTVCFSPDGKMLAAAFDFIDRGCIRVVDAATGEDRVRINDYEAGASLVAFSPDQRCLAFATGIFFKGYMGVCEILTDPTDGSVKITTPDEAHTIAFSDGVVRSLCFSPDSRYIAAGSEDKFVHLYEAGTAKEVRKMPCSGKVECVHFSPDGRLLCVGEHLDGNGLKASGNFESTGLLRVLDVKTGDEMTQKVCKEGVAHAEFSADGRFIAASFGDGVLMMEPSADEEISRRDFYGDPVLCFHPDGERLVVGGENDDRSYSSAAAILGESPEDAAPRKHKPRQLHVIHAATGKKLKELEFDHDVSSVSFSAEGRFVALGGRSAAARVMELTTGRRFLEGAEPVCFSPGGPCLVKRGEGEPAMFVSLPSEAPGRKFDFGDWGRLMSFDREGRHLATGGADEKEVRVIDTATGEEVHKIKLGEKVISLALSPDARHLVAGCDGVLRTNGDAWAVDLSTGKQTALTNFEGKVSAMCFSADGRHVAVGNDVSKSEVRVFETETWSEIKRFKAAGRVASLSFSANGRYLAVASDYQGVNVIDCGWHRLEEGAVPAWSAALRLQSGQSFQDGGHLTICTTEELKAAQKEVEHFINSSLLGEGLWQREILYWASTPPEERKTSPWCDTLQRDYAGRALMEVGRYSWEIVGQHAAKAPWHPLVPVALALNEREPDDPQFGPPREASRLRFLALLTLKRLREANEELYGRSTLAEYAAWCAKVMHADLYLNAEAKTALDFALERTPPEKQEELLELKARIEGK